MPETTNARWLKWSLTAIAVFLGLIVIELSVLIGPMTPAAQAQIPDSGLQRQQLLETQRATNDKLEAILQHLRTQTIKVKVVSTDKETKRTPAAPPRAPVKEPDKKVQVAP